MNLLTRSLVLCVLSGASVTALAQAPAAPAKPGEAKPAAPAKPGEAKPAEAKPAPPAKPGEAKPAGEKPAGPPNLILNGQFTKFTTEDNLWDGVNASGALS